MDAKSYTSWQLARLAEVTDPDAHDGLGFENPEPREGSAGAQFLRSVAYSVEEFVNDPDDDQDPDDRVFEIADGAVPIYTHALWMTFVDLAAYDEDITDHGADASDLNKVASVALYAIAERLAHALLDAEKDDDDDDD